MALIEKRNAKDGTTTYRARIRLKGHREQNASFERLTDARKWAQDTESAIRDGRHFKTSEAKRHTLSELIDRYVRDVLPHKPKSEKDQRRQLEWWKARIGDKLLSDVTPALISETRDRLASGMLKDGSMTVEVKDSKRKTVRQPVEPRSPATVIRYLAILSHAFTIASKEWQWIESNPLKNVRKPSEPRGRVRYLSDDERDKLLAECLKSGNQDLYLAVILAISTGARKMEIMSLRWKQVDLERGVITLYETKNGEIRALPLVSKALGLMKQRAKVRRIDTDLVFPSKHASTQPIDLRLPFETALKDAGIVDFKWHDLRHTCASYLLMNGASLAEIAGVLGHKTLAMVKRYAHMSHAHTAKVVEKMNKKIFG